MLAEIASLSQQLEELQARHDELQTQRDELQARHDELQARHDSVAAEREQEKHAVEEMKVERAAKAPVQPLVTCAWPAHGLLTA